MQIDRNGILILYKPQGWTSFDVIAKARGILSTRKVGHSGTLDPMATGVLPVFMGRATKAVDMQIIKDKEYIATFKLGLNTDTGDVTGEVINQRPVTATKEDVLAEMENFRGEITQLPPMYSAVKINGQPLYKLARRGVTVENVERKPRKAVIKELVMLEDDSLEENEYKIRVLCSEGTYIRTLVEDMGENLGCGAVLSSLSRTKACGYTLEDCITLEELQQARADDTIDSLIVNTDTVFMHLDRIDLSPELAKRLLNGARSRIAKPDGDYRVYYRDKFYAIANVAEKKMSVVKLFVEKEKENIDA
ncbi:MAG: tRNA pseudouridine(55) synthase TruB [Oscillospiraceae bacterium]|nr:tRNA pseudouridine(55) synthase TruB [Oscillospiraceae bacterium]